MAKILYVGTHGTDDPTAATFPFLMAKGAIDAGHETGIILMGEAAPLIKDHIAQQVHGIGIPPLKELMDFLATREVRISVWGLCGRARGVTEEDFVGKNSGFGTPVDAANAHAEYDRVVSFWHQGHPGESVLEGFSNFAEALLLGFSVETRIVSVTTSANWGLLRQK